MHSYWASTLKMNMNIFRDHNTVQNFITWIIYALIGYIIYGVCNSPWCDPVKMALSNLHHIAAMVVTFVSTVTICTGIKFLYRHPVVRFFRKVCGIDDFTDGIVEKGPGLISQLTENIGNVTPSNTDTNQLLSYGEPNVVNPTRYNSRQHNIPTAKRQLPFYCNQADPNPHPQPNQDQFTQTNQRVVQNNYKPLHRRVLRSRERDPIAQNEESVEHTNNMGYTNGLSRQSNPVGRPHHRQVPSTAGNRDEDVIAENKELVKRIEETKRRILKRRLSALQQEENNTQSSRKYQKIDKSVNGAHISSQTHQMTEQFNTPVVRDMRANNTNATDDTRQMRHNVNRRPDVVLFNRR